MRGLAEVIPVTDFCPRRKNVVLHLAVWALDAGFEADGLTLISEQDVLGDRLIRQTKRKRRAENFLTEANSLERPVIWWCMSTTASVRSCRARGCDRPWVPHMNVCCWNMQKVQSFTYRLKTSNCLSKYGHETGLLDKLGGGAWQAKKAKLKERIRQIAERLIRVAAERALRTAPALDPPEALWDQFLARFPYVETDDQLAAIEDVLTDLGSGKPMDRLICGDVGLWQDRGRDPRRIHRRHVRCAGRNHCADHVVSKATLSELRRTISWFSD